MQSVENSIEEAKLLAVFLSLMLLGSTLNFGVIGILSDAYALESSGMESIDIYTSTSTEFSEELIDTSKITTFEIENMGQSSLPVEYEEGIDTSNSLANTNIIEPFEESVLTPDLSEEPMSNFDKLRSLVLSGGDELSKILSSSPIREFYAVKQPLWPISMNKLSGSSLDTSSKDTSLASISLPQMIIPSFPDVFSQQSSRIYEVSVAPNESTASTNVTYNVTVRNSLASSSGSQIGSFRLVIDSSFTNLSILSCCQVVDQNGNPVAKTWLASLDGNTVNANGQTGQGNPNDKLTPGLAVQFTINATNPTAGSYNFTNISLTHVFPSTDFSGNEFTFNPDNSQITVTIIQTNQPPVANNDSYSTNEDATLNVNGVLDNDTDVNGDNLSAILVSNTTNGSLTLNANGSFSYGPNANFNGVDNFTYVANDGSLNSSVATVTITVNPVNDAPDLIKPTIPTEIDEEIETMLVFNASDVEITRNETPAQTLAFSLTGIVPLGASIDPSNGTFTWTPANNQGPGTYTFNVRVTDDGSPPEFDEENITLIVNEVADVSGQFTVTNNDDGSVGVNVGEEQVPIGNTTEFGLVDYSQLGNNTTIHIKTAAVEVDFNDSATCIVTIFTSDPNNSICQKKVVKKPDASLTDGSVVAMVFENLSGVCEKDGGTVNVTVNGTHFACDRAVVTQTFDVDADGNNVSDGKFIIEDIFTAGTKQKVNFTTNVSGTYLLEVQLEFMADELVTQGDPFNGVRTVIRIPDPTISSDTGNTHIDADPLVRITQGPVDCVATSGLASFHGVTCELWSPRNSQDPVETKTCVDADSNGTPDEGSDPTCRISSPPTILPTPCGLACTEIRMTFTGSNLTDPGQYRFKGTFLQNFSTEIPEEGKSKRQALFSIIDRIQVKSVQFNNLDQSVVVLGMTNAEFDNFTVMRIRPGDPNILVTSVFGVFGNQFTVDPVTRTAPPPTLDAKYSVAWNTTTGMCPGNETVTGVSPDGFGDPLQITVPSINYTTHKCFVSVLEFELPNDTFPDGIDVLETKILFQVDNSSNITYINPPNCDWMPIVNQPSATNDSNSVYRDINNGTAYLTNDTNCTLAGNQTVILGGDANQDLENNTGVNWFAVGIRPYNRTLNSSRSSTAIFSSDTASPIPPTVIPTLNVTYNQAPSVSNVSFSTNEDTDKNVTLSGNDTGGENLTFFINADSVGPCPGQLNITSTAATQVQATYHPCANFNGNETFQYHVQDNFNKTSNNATITFIVAAVNDAPVANNDSYSTNEDTNLTVNGVLANDTDVDGDNLTAILVSGPASGTLNLSSNGSFTYIPALNFNGVVNFTYKANDGLLNSSVVATVTITVISVNDAPNATIKKDNGNLSACVDDVAVPSNMTKLTSITLSGVCSSDIDGNITSYSWTATKGTLSNKTSPTPTYTAPSVTRNTDVTITLTVTDNNGATKTTSVIIKVLK